jgi:glycosyltransferase involved in cell wall biosynthesis
VRVLGHAVVPQPAPQTFDERDGFLFVGPTYTDDAPNSDSIVWFVDRVLPAIRREIGREVPLAVAGIQNAPQVTARAGRFTPLGPLPDLTQAYTRARVFVAPTRFANGIPIKVQDAAARGIPAVVTPLVAEQLGWRHEQEALLAAAPEDFAAQCLRLHRDGALWRRLRECALRRVARDCDPRTFSCAVEAVLRQVPFAKAGLEARPAPKTKRPGQ